MQYHVAYDIQQITYPYWWLILIGLIVLMFGTFFVFRGRVLTSVKLESEDDVRRRIGPIVCAGLGLAGIYVGLLNYSDFVSLRAATRKGPVNVVEGRITQFAPKPYWGGPPETFVVNGQKFSYSDNDLTKGFNQTQSHGGPLREGQQVRITYVGEAIVKLEIAP